MKTFSIGTFILFANLLLPCFHATERKSHTYAQEVITIFGIQISVQQWHWMGTDHSLQALQIPSFRSKCFCCQSLGFAFKQGIFSILPWQRNITWPQMVMSKFRNIAQCKNLGHISTKISILIARNNYRVLAKSRTVALCLKSGFQ